MLKSLTKQQKQALAMTDDVQSIVKPLLDTTPLKSFSYASIQKNTDLCYVGTMAEALEYYYQQDYHSLKTFMEHPDFMKYHATLWQSIEGSEIVNTMRELFDISNGLTILKKAEDRIHIYNFAASKSDKDMPNWYLNNIENLDQFIAYFHEKSHSLLDNVTAKRLDIKEQKKVRIAHEKMFSLKPQKQSPQAFQRQTFLNTYELVEDGEKVLLQRREIQCLACLISGCTAEESGKILHLSKRTVEDYIGQLRAKLACKTKSELIHYVMARPIAKILAHEYSLLTTKPN